MAYTVTAADIAGRWRPLSEAETTVAEALIVDASAILDARLPSLDAQVAADDVAPALVTAVIAQMVLRVLRNPDGKRQEQIDDYSWTRDTALSAGLLYVTDEELALLRPVAAGGSDGAFSIRPTGQSWFGAGLPT